MVLVSHQLTTRGWVRTAIFNRRKFVHDDVTASTPLKTGSHPFSSARKYHFLTERTNDTMRKSSIELKIQKKFTEKMQNPRVPLLHDFDAYASHLPVRNFQSRQVKTKRSLRLYEADYLARPADLQHMTSAIEDTTIARSAVRYLSAPTSSGKTASVLPAFLGSKAATHYLYMPFSNNGYYHFNAIPRSVQTTDPGLAELQGAAFMVQCVKNLFEGKRGGPIPNVNETEMYQLGTSVLFGRYSNELAAYLIEKLGEDAYVWFHIDEHREMIDRDYKDDQKTKAAAAFSRGAMQVLTSSDSFYSIAVATYTEPPNELPSAASSTVCRVPVALPRLDIDQVLPYVPELNMDKINLTTSIEERLWSTLRVRLAMKIEQLGMLFVLHRRSDDEKVKAFLAEFQKTVQAENDSSTTLKKLNNLCIIANATWTGLKLNNENAAKLLLGARDNNEDSDWLFKKRIKSGIIVIEPDALITCSLKTLLTLEDPNIEPYNIGRDLFIHALQHSKPDLLSCTPLEYAYFWALACQSAVMGSIAFGPPELRFKIQCKELVPGRLFEGTSNKLHKHSLKHVKKNVMYYADEPRDHHRVTSGANVTTSKTSYPQADLFFVTDSNQLVLIDITGGIKDTVEEKLCKKTHWFQANSGKKLSLQNGECINEIRCVILAPNIDTDFEQTKGVNVVCGNDARRALGGLAQILPWLEDAKKPAISN